MAKTGDTPAPIENPLARNTENSVQTDIPWWRHLLDPKWLSLIVVLAVVVPGTVFGFSRLRSAAENANDDQEEVSIGEFHFLADANEQNPIVGATFSLHLAFIPEAKATGHARLTTHMFRVQQDIEQLLRQAHGGDFDDPTLGDLKRQLQAQVNETLGIRAVSDVIVTDLKLQYSRSTPPSESVDSVAENKPWTD